MDGVENGSASCDESQLIESVLASGQRGGYVFTYVPLGTPISETGESARLHRSRRKS